eukprot:CAMPEP_0172824548 /NCGR_PEP_ID=MMETSP1075-20121228/18080_1 /TAXON_ID=2916 /ORGANISM="Ceratium fusus, Strain PA161109" /LENGTH=387 /DNA_ID=CAMNT_0013665851 /DNA_START=13 /DNA_END=1172 /DNA_ORIENTATION=-
MPSFAGTIKSYNSQKGWGFIECEETHKLYGKDMFVMRTSLPGGNAERGEEVSFDVVQGAAGPEATQVAFKRTEDLSSWPTLTADVLSNDASKSSYVGNIKSYNPQKGWGFVTSEEIQQVFGKDLFFLRGSARSGQVSAGDRVRFVVESGAKGPEAVDLEPLAVPTPQGGCGVRRSASLGHQMPWQYPAVRGHAAMPALPAIGWAIGPQAIAPWAQPGHKEQTLYGSVKNYSEEKGWGHIDCEAATQTYGKDVFLMKSALNGQDVVIGALVAFRIQLASKGPQAVEVSVLPEGSFGNKGKPGQIFTGHVKSFNPEKGWGFLTSDEMQQIFGKDIFLHRQELDGTIPNVGDVMQFSVEQGRTGQLEAKNVITESYSPLRMKAEGHRTEP